jgi:tape measure domain-containing protein
MENTLQIIMRLKDEATGELQKTVKNINSAFNDAEKSSNNFKTALSDVGKIAAGIGLYKLVDWAVSYTKAMITAGIETAKFYENTKIGYTTLLKDGKEAQKVINEIKATALKTPFDVSALLKANQLLISTGLSAKESQKAIVLLGNAILATGGGNDELMRMAVNLQQIKNLGQATALDIRQFAFAGIPIYKMLAEAQGKSVEQVKDMKITYDMLIDAFEKAAQKGGMFYKGIENAAGSFQQIQSNLKENLDVFFC